MDATPPALDDRKPAFFGVGLEKGNSGTPAPLPLVLPRVSCFMCSNPGRRAAASPEREWNGSMEELGFFCGDLEEKAR